MNPERQRLIDRARELDTREFSSEELQSRIQEICSEYVIEAKVDVARLLKHPDWQVRYSALNIVWWGLGKTTGIDEAIEILLRDPEEECQAQACLVLYEASKGKPDADRVIEVLRSVALKEPNDYVREAAEAHLHKLIATRSAPTQR